MRSSTSPGDRPQEAAVVTPATALAETLVRIYDLDLTTTSGGNLSVRERDESIWITPAGGDKGALLPEDVVHVDANDRPEGPGRPSSELPFHRAIYAERDDLAAIVHAHPVALVAWSVVGEVPDTRISREAHALCGRVGFAPYALPGSTALGHRIADAFGEGFDCVVLENHGVVVGGRSLREAFERLEALDLCARTIGAARVLGGERLLDASALANEANASGPTIPRDGRAAGHRCGAEERALRETLLRIARRAQRKRLATTTQGRFSARLDEHDFIATPAGPTLDVDPDALVRRSIRAGEEGAQEPTLALHAAIYRAHPDVGAIAQGVGAHASGFAVAGVDLPARTIPESHLLVRDPRRIDERVARETPESVAAALGADTPVALIEHTGAIALGRGVLDAFDRLEVLEATAAAVLAARPLGTLTPMSDERIEELRHAWMPAGGWGGPPPED
jgi:L-fuculose-phosphate aldolase